MDRSIPAWELYERMIARMAVEELSPEYSVTPNARLIGKISKRSRQIDVLIDLRDRDNSRRVIVDAKNRSRKIDVKDIEAFRGLMEDVGATHGHLVCPQGHTKAAELRAESLVCIRLVPLDSLKDFDPSIWPACQAHTCKSGRVFWDGYPELGSPLIPISAYEMSQFLGSPHSVGKCDRCGRFHIKCLTCGEILSAPESDDNDYGHRCSCEPPWFWLGVCAAETKSRSMSEFRILGNESEVPRRGSSDARGGRRV